MKFKDIPQFTSYGSYEVNQSLRYLPEWIRKNQEETGLELNPDFQRGHVWTECQQIRYMEYLLHGGKSARTILFNHPGWMGNFKGTFVCVDGLQRITTCLKFMDDKLPVFGGYYLHDFEDKIPRDIDLKLNINNLQTRREVLQWYIELNSEGTIHTDAEIDRVKELLRKEGE